ncbi:MAG TPA: glucose dehydrogenase [Anaerolineae bacterium]|nr:glucose dehydrogenase [Anaerolineae bacterium]
MDTDGSVLRVAYCVLRSKRLLRNTQYAIFLLAGLLAACGSNLDVTVTPPVVEQTTAVSPTAIPPTDAPPPEPSPTTAAPEAPTAVPTDIPPTLTAVPTDTPDPGRPAASIQLEPAAEGFAKPVYLTHAGDERLFVVEQEGTIRIVADGNVLAAPFLDIRDRVGADASERGLLSVAFHPQYGDNGRFFVNYTNKDGNTVVSRFRVNADDSNTADPASEEILFTIGQPYPNHNGGQLQFGPDGYLYVGMGDGGLADDPEENGQNKGTLLGALLRIDVNVADAPFYGVPADNPFVNDEDGRNEIWAIGLRNPWRFSFDRLTGNMFIADVGQNEWEEIHVQPADSPGGENYGWDIMEGFHCFKADSCDQTGLELPVFEYDHSFGCSITGGYVYRGAAYPELSGNYFFGDFCSGNIWRLFPEGADWSDAIVRQSGLNISSFGEDVNGELYVLDYGSGTVYRIGNR